MKSIPTTRPPQPYLGAGLQPDGERRRYRDLDFESQSIGGWGLRRIYGYRAAGLGHGNRPIPGRLHRTGHRNPRLRHGFPVDAESHPWRPLRSEEHTPELT